MLTKRIIPCLDVKDGRVVKGVSFVDLRDAGDPVEVATVYDQEGADELCFLDITASHEKRKTLLDVVARTAEQVFMPLTVGGGVRTLEDIRSLLNAAPIAFHKRASVCHKELQWFICPRVANGDILSGVEVGSNSQESASFATAVVNDLAIVQS